MTVQRAIRKVVPSVLSAAAQLPLLIGWRSVHEYMWLQNHASMFCNHIYSWLNWAEKLTKKKPDSIIVFNYGYIEKTLR